METRKGKNRCRILKEIRRKIAEENDIAFVTSECTYQGDCAGTCPKCEAEVRELERELEKRRRAGKAVAIAGVAAAVTLTATSCGTVVTTGEMAVSEAATGVPPQSEEVLQGVIAAPEEVLQGRIAVPEEESSGEETVLQGEPEEYVLTGDIALPDTSCEDGACEP